ncbi:Transcriptional coactivator Hfi1/Transcriptional adapter 1 [Phaffia rhodozyma]|uniref:Transcriptional coactivator Hfi1/Transcriptional adapter 1 n=1 Tax=Phaffia rhodozyma TaxID=264483 RepID=A0A0F7SIE5_PHARH|nr:Transcriptional coactivator Hfi1/Transcriptional adapter 1 [Phaffia rhodozyma]
MASIHPSSPTSLKGPMVVPSRPLAPYVRIDTLKIKQHLHDALGSNGLAYWKTLQDFITGRLSRDELDDLVTEWGVGDKRIIPLHNQFLMAILSNAANSTITPATETNVLKRSRPDDPTEYGAKRRVVNYVLGMPKGERERIKAKHMIDTITGQDAYPHAREQRRRDGTGWVGVSELSRERAILGPTNGIDVNQASGESGSGPTSESASLSSTNLPPLPTALEMRMLPDHQQLKERIQRLSTECGLTEVEPGVSEIVDQAVQACVRNFITTHLHLHRANLSSTPSIKSSIPAFFNSEPASPSASSSSSFMPQTPPNTFTQEALEGILTVTPSLALPEGNVGRRICNRIMTAEDFEEAWDDDRAERQKVLASGRMGLSSGGSFDEGEGGLASVDATEGPEVRKKGYSYSYRDPRSILDSVLGL